VISYRPDTLLVTQPTASKHWRSNQIDLSYSLTQKISIYKVLLKVTEYRWQMVSWWTFRFPVILVNHYNKTNMTCWSASQWNIHSTHCPAEQTTCYRATLCINAVFAVAWCPSVCPSVCLSVTLVDCIQTAKDTVKLFSLPGSRIILVSLTLRRYPIPSGTPSAGAQNTRSGKIWRFSTEIAVYLRNGAR